MKVSVIGLGKLGAPLAAHLALAGHHVIGVDRDQQVVHALETGRPLSNEPGLAQLLGQVRDRFQATPDLSRAVHQTTVSFVVVPTPSRRDGAFALRYVRPAMRLVGRALATKEDYHLVVLTSTVMPGATEKRIKPLLEQAAGKHCGRDFGLCYSPEFVALGSVLADLASPELALIGESDRQAGDRLVEVLKPGWQTAPPIKRMSFTNAELAKLAVNTLVTTKIAFANLLGELCEKLPGGNVDQVTRAVGCDSRIGPKCLRAGLGYGGPCFPRDNRALAALAAKLKVRASLPRATDRTNRRQVARLKKVVLASLPPRGKVGVLGLTYKPLTPVLERSQGLQLAIELQGAGVPVMVYDPLVGREAAGPFQEYFRIAGSLEECARKVDVLVICTPCAEFKALDDFELGPSDFRSFTIIDCWRLLNAEQLACEIRYLALGRHPKAQLRAGSNASKVAPRAP